MLFMLFTAYGPASGTYTFTVVGEENDCPDSFSGMDSPAGDQTLTVESDTEMTLEGNPSEPCELDGMFFECHFDDIDAVQDYTDSGYDAVYTIDAEMNGEWLTTTTIEGSMSITTSCEGPDCSALAVQGVPECTISWDYEGTL